MPESTDVPSPVMLLQRAADVALEHPEHTSDRLAAIHRVALFAVHLDDGPTLERMIAELDSPAHRAHLQVVRARKWDALGGLQVALEHAHGAVAALDLPGRWRPVLPDWVGTDSARADLCTLLVVLGDDRAAAAVARELRRGTVHHVRSVAALARLLPAADGWEMVCEAVSAVERASERTRAALAVLESHRPGPRLGPEAHRALSLVDAVLGESPEPAATKGAARVAARLAQVFLEVPALSAALEAWGRAVSLAGDCPGNDPDAVAVLCAVTQDQISRVGEGPASVTWQSLLDRLSGNPLPPDPPHRGPWASVLAVALAHPVLAVPLARIIARHPAVPSAWAHALGLLHVAGERPDRAVRVAEVLATAADRHEEDHESRLLAGLLYALGGDGDGAWEHLLRALGDDGPRMTWLSGADGPQRYEQWSVDALLAGGFSELAVLYARMVAEPDVRAHLLARCLTRMPAGEGAASLGEEVASALAEAREADVSPSLDAGLARLFSVAWASGDEDRATALLAWQVEALQPTGTAAWLSGAGLLHQALDAIGPSPSELTRPLVEGWNRRIATASLEEQLELILGWLHLLERDAGP